MSSEVEFDGDSALEIVLKDFALRTGQDFALVLSPESDDVWTAKIIPVSEIPTTVVGKAAGNELLKISDRAIRRGLEWYAQAEADIAADKALEERIRAGLGADEDEDE